MKTSGQKIGYARTSTTEQKAGIEDQVNELSATGCDKIYREHISGTSKSRPQLNSALEFCREGDVFVVTKPDRLARSVGHLMEIKEYLANKGVGFRVLSMGLDTASATGKLMLGVLASVAEFERELMLERQKAGIAKAKVEGKYKGRPMSIDRAAVMKELRNNISPSKIAINLGISRSAVYRIKEEIKLS